MNWPGDYINKIICGDCLEVMKGIPDGVVDLVITDPPYESLDKQIFKGGSTPRLMNMGWFDTLSGEDLFEIINILGLKLKQEGALYIFADVKSGLYIFPSLLPKNVIVWDKKKLGMGYNWRRMHEWIAYCPGLKHRLRDKGLGDIIRESPPYKRVHPTQKPEGVITPLILNSSDKDNIILDPFCGSGTTCVAAKQLGRKYIGIEVSPEYCKIAEQRLSQEELFGVDRA